MSFWGLWRRAGVTLSSSAITNIHIQPEVSHPAKLYLSHSAQALADPCPRSLVARDVPDPVWGWAVVEPSDRTTPPERFVLPEWPQHICVCRKFLRQLRDNGGWESFVPSAPVRCPKGAGVRQALIPRDLVSSSESCWLIWSKNLALRLDRWGQERTVYCAKSVGKQKLQKSPNLDFGQGTSVSNATLDERSKFCWHDLKSRISKIGRM